jgi:hypothetical protein
MAEPAEGLTEQVYVVKVAAFPPWREAAVSFEREDDGPVLGPWAYRLPEGTAHATLQDIAAAVRTTCRNACTRHGFTRPGDFTPGPVAATGMQFRADVLIAPDDPETVP